jgi:hypothetical protein
MKAMIHRFCQWSLKITIETGKWQMKGKHCISRTCSGSTEIERWIRENGTSWVIDRDFTVLNSVKLRPSSTVVSLPATQELADSRISQLVTVFKRAHIWSLYFLGWKDYGHFGMSATIWSTVPARVIADDDDDSEYGAVGGVVTN